MRSRTAVVAALATALAVGVPGAAAVAAPAETSYTVVPYTNVNVRKLPTAHSAYLTTLTAGRSYRAYCWTHGQTVTDNGYTNDVWIGFADGYSSAVYFEGDAYAGLPASARC
ncbi:SH3 domain-containing protein [Streptomyces cellostaticus]|uniref:SH3 domain-containing protein n=1 Tax=Streptomyces cellostaticus TaxID=67285 RepID=UPI0020262D72|nr:SH3 domain-containing protein [Streptomyces cellostaticus]